MSYDCCKALGRWCGSFTRTERLLTVLEAIFLAFFISLLTYLILHLLACCCGGNDVIPVEVTTDTASSAAQTTSGKVTGVSTGASSTSTEASDTSTGGRFNDTTATETATEHRQTEGKSCSWTPSSKTTTVTRYYLHEAGRPATGAPRKLFLTTRDKFSSNSLFHDTVGEVDERTAAEGLVLGLARARPAPSLACLLAVVGDRWAVTAASCVHRTEALRHPDRYVMLPHQAESVKHGHGVSAVRVHPKYSSNTSHYDVCALKSTESFRTFNTFLILPTPIDQYLTVVGDRLTAFGIWKIRSRSSLRAVAVRALSARRCGRTGGGTCAGRAGGGHCGAGSPLLRGRTLLAVRAGRARGDCAPAHYRSIAPHAPWLRSHVDSNINLL